MILAINTATDENSIAIYKAGQIAAKSSWRSYRTQSQELLPRIAKLIKKNKIKLANLKAIAVFQGPGSYTGLRVGISVANTFAWSLNIPIIGIKSKTDCFDALEVAKAAQKIILKKKMHGFSKIILPYYNLPLR